MIVKTIVVGFGYHRTPVLKLQERIKKATKFMVDPMVATDNTGGVLYVFEGRLLSDAAVRVLSAFFDQRRMTFSMVENISGNSKFENHRALHNLGKAKILKEVEVCGLEMFELITEEVQ